MSMMAGFDVFQVLPPWKGGCPSAGRDRLFWNRTSEVRTAGSRMHNLGLPMLTSRGG